jgi:hypothetical protein
MHSAADGSWTLPAVDAAQGVGSSSSSSSSSSGSSGYRDVSWIEPGVDDTLVSNLVFMLPSIDLTGMLNPSQLQQLLLSPAKPGYQLLVPQEAVAAAEAALAAVAASQAAAAAAPAEQAAQELAEDNESSALGAQKQQQWQQLLQQHSNNNSSSSAGTEWHADYATERLLNLLPERWGFVPAELA